MNDETHSWGAGGIFGQSAEDALEVLDEMNEGPYPDGNGGFREKPGVANRLGAEEAISRRRRKEAERRKMLVVERLIDELPDLRDKFLDSLGPDGLGGKLRETLLRRFVSQRPQRQMFAPEPESIAEAVGERILDVAAEVLLRAYDRDIKRAQAAVRLGAFGPEEWAQAQAQKVLAAPSTVAKTIMAGAEALAARVKHVANAISEPLGEPEPETPPEETAR